MAHRAEVGGPRGGNVPPSGGQQSRGAGASCEPHVMTVGAAGLGGNENKKKHGKQIFRRHLPTRKHHAMWGQEALGGVVPGRGAGGPAPASGLTGCSRGSRRRAASPRSSRWSNRTGTRPRRTGRGSPGTCPWRETKRPAAPRSRADPAEPPPPPRSPCTGRTSPPRIGGAACAPGNCRSRCTGLGGQSAGCVTAPSNAENQANGSARPPHRKARGALGRNRRSG